MQRFASIDLGTNTCNLLIADYNNNRLETVCLEKRAVMLLKNSVNAKTIAQDAVARCLEIVSEYSNLIELHHADVIIANATSGVRSSDNGAHIVELLKKETGIGFKILSGSDEAQLIHNGVLRAIEYTDKPMLLLDIGGGSNEFVIFEGETILWKKSFDLGISRLLNMFQLSDPLINNNLAPVFDYIDEELSELYSEMELYNIDTLAGSSGTFETLSNIIRCNNNTSLLQMNNHTIGLADFDIMYRKMITLNREQRLALKGMEAMRVDLMPLALAFVHHLLQRLYVKQIIHSRYSIKEGAIFSYIKKHNVE